MALPVEEQWFARRRVDDAITLLWEPHVHRVLQCNIWHVRGRDRDLLVDTGLGIASLRGAAADLFGHALVAVASHFHYDHTGSMHEFDARAIHPSEARIVATPGEIGGSLVVADLRDDTRRSMSDAGYDMDCELLVTAVPATGYDVAAFAVVPFEPTMVLEEGDVLDLGDRAFEVLHLPGHSPGGIALWDAASGTLFSGDTVYDGPLLDEGAGTDIEAYVHSMERLRALPVTVVHGGHDPSFGRERLVELADAYLERRRPLFA